MLVNKIKHLKAKCNFTTPTPKLFLQVSELSPKTLVIPVILMWYKLQKILQFNKNKLMTDVLNAVEMNSVHNGLILIFDTPTKCPNRKLQILNDANCLTTTFHQFYR